MSSSRSIGFHKSCSSEKRKRICHGDDRLPETSVTSPNADKSTTTNCRRSMRNIGTSCHGVAKIEATTSTSSDSVENSRRKCKINDSQGNKHSCRNRRTLDGCTDDNENRRLQANDTRFSFVKPKMAAPNYKKTQSTSDLMSCSRGNQDKSRFPNSNTPTLSMVKEPYNGDINASSVCTRSRSCNYGHRYSTRSAGNVISKTINTAVRSRFLRKPNSLNRCIGSSSDINLCKLRSRSVTTAYCGSNSKTQCGESNDKRSISCDKVSGAPKGDHLPMSIKQKSGSILDSKKTCIKRNVSSSMPPASRTYFGKRSGTSDKTVQVQPAEMSATTSNPVVAGRDKMYSNQSSFSSLQNVSSSSRDEKNTKGNIGKILEELINRCEILEVKVDDYLALYLDQKPFLNFINNKKGSGCNTDSPSLSSSGSNSNDNPAKCAEAESAKKSTTAYSLTLSSDDLNAMSSSHSTLLSTSSREDETKLNISKLIGELVNIREKKSGKSTEASPMLFPSQKHILDADNIKRCTQCNASSPSLPSSDSTLTKTSTNSDEDTKTVPVKAKSALLRPTEIDLDDTNRNAKQSVEQSSSDLTVSNTSSKTNNGEKRTTSRILEELLNKCENDLALSKNKSAIVPTDQKQRWNENIIKKCSACGSDSPSLSHSESSMCSETSRVAKLKDLTESNVRRSGNNTYNNSSPYDAAVQAHDPGETNIKKSANTKLDWVGSNVNQNSGIVIVILGETRQIAKNSRTESVAESTALTSASSDGNVAGGQILSSCSSTATNESRQPQAKTRFVCDMDESNNSGSSFEIISNDSQRAQPNSNINQRIRDNKRQHENMVNLFGEVSSDATSDSVLSPAEPHRNIISNLSNTSAIISSNTDEELEMLRTGRKGGNSKGSNE